MNTGKGSLGSHEAPLPTGPEGPAGLEGAPRSGAYGSCQLLHLLVPRRVWPVSSDHVAAPVGSLLWPVLRVLYIPACLPKSLGHSLITLVCHLWE